MTDKQQQAHDLYFATGKTQQEIAEILNVSRKTINGWVKRNRWDEMKAAARQMPSLILQDIYTHINAVNDKIFNRDESDRCPTPKEVQMLYRLLAMTRQIQKQHTGSYIEAFQELQLFIFNRNEELAMQLRGHIADYARGTLGDKEFMARKKRKNNVLDATANLAKQEMREQNEQSDVTNGEQECNPDVTSCNPGVPHLQSVATPPAQHAPLAVQTGCSPSPLPHDHRAAECNPDVTSCNPGVPHLQSVATPPAQLDPLAVQTGCSPSPLPQGDHTSSQADPLLDQADHGPECNPNVTSCNPDENPAANTENPSKVFTVATNGDIRIPRDDSKSHKENLSDNVTFAPEEHTPGDTKFFTQAISLPPHMRPSPFIDGNTVWMLHPDHLESRYDTYGNPWGPMKMSYTIRYYPDIDPANSKAA